MAGEVHPVPFRTRKLSPPAPMVLRSESVGEQDVADQRGAFSCAEGPPGPALCVGRARAAPLCVGRRAAAPRGSPSPAPRVVCKTWRRPAPLAGGGAGAYINSSRDGAAADAGGPSAGRTLRTGYRDRRGRASYRQHYYLGWLASARQAPRRFLSLNGR